MGDHTNDTPGLEQAERGHVRFHAEALEDRHQGRNQRLADEELGAAAVVEERHVGPLAREQGGERGACGTGADDRDSHGGHPRRTYRIASGSGATPRSPRLPSRRMSPEQ